MGSLFIKDLIIYGALIFFVLFITKQNNLWGTKRGTSKTKVEVHKAKDTAKRRNYLLWVLKKCEYLGNNFGFEPSPAKIVKYRFNINRGRFVLPYVDRPITPVELIGLFKALKFFFCFLGIFLTVLTGFQEEDKEIELDFPDLYMLLYSRLVRGTSMRLAPTLDDYMKSIDVIYGEESHKAIRHFVMDLRKNIEILGDDSMAVHKMRDTYRSAMLVNFFNLAIQALRGVDNRDKLLAFKMELSQKKLDQMTVRANELVAKGQKAVMLIFIILAQFVVLSWIAKAGLSFMQL